MEKKPQLTFSKKELLTKSFKIPLSNNNTKNTNNITNKNNKKKDSKSINIDITNKKNIPQKINPRKEPMKFLHNCFMGAGINILNQNNISPISDNDSVNMSFYNNPNEYSSK